MSGSFCISFVLVFQVSPSFYTVWEGSTGRNPVLFLCVFTEVSMHEDMLGFFPAVYLVL